MRSGFNSRQGIHVSKAIYYFILSLVAIGRGITSLMRIGFLYYNCLAFDLASGYTLHYTEYCSGSTEETGSFHLVAVAGWN